MLGVGGAAFVGRPTTLVTIVQAMSSGAAPTGTVIFTANGAPIPGTLTLQGISGSFNNFALLNVVLSNVVFNTVGPIVITASYGGDSNYAPSSASGTVNVMGSVTSTLSVNTVNPQPGAAVTVTCLIATSVKSPMPTGLVSFDDLTDILGSLLTLGTPSYSQITDANGNAELQATLTFVPPTYKTIMEASYGGDPNFGPANSNPVTIVVAGNDFGMYLDPFPATASTTSGLLGLQHLRIYGQSNYNGTINFTPSSCSGLPAESSCSFSPASIAGNGATMILISVTAPHAASSMRVGSRHVPLLWGSGSAMLCLLLAAGPFGRRSYRFLSILLIALLLTIPSCGGGSSGGGGGGSGGPTDPGTRVGTYTVTVTATSGSLTHTATFQLVVQ